AAAGGGADPADAECDDRAVAHPLPDLPPGDRRHRVAVDRGASANSAPAGRADGARCRREGAWRARRQDGPEGEGDVGSDRQCRPVLWRRHFHRDRLDRADPADPRDPRLRHRAAAPRAVGDPQRDRRLLHPFGPAAVVRPQAEAPPAMITMPWLYALAGAMFAAFAILSLAD